MGLNLLFFTVSTSQITIVQAYLVSLVKASFSTITRLSTTLEFIIHCNCISTLDCDSGVFVTVWWGPSWHALAPDVVLTVSHEPGVLWTRTLCVQDVAGSIVRSCATSCGAGFHLAPTASTVSTRTDSVMAQSVYRWSSFKVKGNDFSSRTRLWSTRSIAATAFWHVQTTSSTRHLSTSSTSGNHFILGARSSSVQSIAHSISSTCMEVLASTFSSGAVGSNLGYREGVASWTWAQRI